MNMHVKILQTQKLADDTLADIKTAFAEFGHYPSEALWAGIEDVVEKLARMADGALRPLPHLSRLDPGVGKTQTATRFISNLLKSADHRDVAVLYCVSRLNEIPGLVASIGKENVAVFTRDDEMNKLGGQEPIWARVLIITHAMVDSRLANGSSFAELAAFHYRGKPRQVRIWDEAMMPGEELTIDLFRLGAMADILRRLSLPLAEKIQVVCEEVRKLESGS